MLTLILLGIFLYYEWVAWETDNGYSVELSIQYLTDAKKEQKVDQYVETFANQYITKDMTDFDRAKVINDYVVQLATYTEKGSTEGQSVFELINEKNCCVSGLCFTNIPPINSI
ncbi:hypothetical protein OL548_32515 [Lysinibacillus sp. MHQ-1]|nr:hypothetical protein OL548_32515 [Lysinibacillus sp. MHQ-1]